jgi:hypothetical protein
MRVLCPLKNTVATLAQVVHTGERAEVCEEIQLCEVEDQGAPVQRNARFDELRGLNAAVADATAANRGVQCVRCRKCGTKNFYRTTAPLFRCLKPTCAWPIASSRKEVT